MEETIKHHYTDVGELIKSLRKKAGLSLKALESKANRQISSSYIYLIEENKHKPSEAKTKILANILGNYEEMMTLAGYSINKYNKYNHVGELVKELRLKQNLTHKGIEKISDGKISGAYISNIEKGKSRPSLNKIKILASILGYYNELAELSGYNINKKTKLEFIFIPLLYSSITSEYPLTEEGNVISYIPFPKSFYFWGKEQIFVIRASQEDFIRTGLREHSFVLFKQLSSKIENKQIVVQRLSGGNLRIISYNEKDDLIREGSIIGVKVGSFDFGSF